MPPYLAQGQSSGTIKIGCTANLKRRMANLKSTERETYTVLRTFAGGLDTELWLQHHFRPYRLRGRDWFRFVPDMLTVEPPHEEDPREHGNARWVLSERQIKRREANGRPTGPKRSEAA